MLFESSPNFYLKHLFTINCIERTNINKKRGREWPIKNKKNNRDKSKTISKQIWTKVGFGDINVACSSNKVDNNKSLSLSLSLSLFKSQITASYLQKHPTSHDLTLTAILIDTHYLPTSLARNLLGSATSIYPFCNLLKAHTTKRSHCPAAATSMTHSFLTSL